MNRFSFDDVFSPVRLDSSTVNISCNSVESDGSKSETSLANSLPNKHIPEDIADFVLKSEKQEKKEMNSHNQDVFPETSASDVFCSPISNRNSNNLLNTKKDSSNYEKIKSNKAITSKNKNIFKKENSDNLQKCKSKKNENIDCNITKLNSEQKDIKKLSRPTSLSSKVSINYNDVTNEEKSASASSKNISNMEHSLEKKLLTNSSNFEENLKLEDASKKSSDLKLKNALLDSTNKKSNCVIPDIENQECASTLPISQYEVLIEKMVHDCVSMEGEKIRETIYMKRMSFYRELNKIKQEMELQHVATAERLLKVIQDLMEMNAVLKSSTR